MSDTVMYNGEDAGDLKHGQIVTVTDRMSPQQWKVSWTDAQGPHEQNVSPMDLVDVPPGG
jgi:hypothetical protein